MSTIEVKVPDIGDFTDIPVIEIFVKPGDAVKAEDSLVTLESDKATMDVPSPATGTVKEVKVKLGDKVSEGSLIVVVDTGAAAPAAVAAKPAAASAPTPPPHRRPQHLPLPQRSQHRHRVHPPLQRRPSTAPLSRPRTRRRPCASSRASSAWISRG